MRRLHPATMIIAFLPALKNAASSLLPFFAVSIVSGKGDMGEVILAGIGVLSGFGAISTYLTTRYWIEDKHLKSTTGWLFKRDRQIPLEHIQNVNLRQNLLERTLKVLTVDVETAAGTTPELKLQVVTAAEAERLRDELLSERAPADAEAPAVVAEPIYRVPPADLWLGAITENHFGHLILFTLPYFGIGAFASLPKFAIAREMVPDSTLVILAVIVGLSLALAGWMVGAVSYALRNARFRVLAEPGAYRISFGLLTRVQYSVRAARIELIESSASIWQTWIRRTGIQVGTAGTFGEQGMTAPIALMLPDGRRDAAIQALIPERRLDDLKWHRHPRFHLYVQVVRGLIGFVFAAAPIVLISTFILNVAPVKAHFVVNLFDAVLALIAFGVVASQIENWLSYRVSGYAIGQDVAAVRHGFFRRKTSYMPLDRVEVAEITEPLFWRKRRLVSVALTGMKHGLNIAMMPADDAQRLVDDLKSRSMFRQSKRREHTPSPQFAVPS